MTTYPVELAAEQAIWKRYDWYAYELPPKQMEKSSPLSHPPGVSHPPVEQLDIPAATA